jgi:hypothetical protein
MSENGNGHRSASQRRIDALEVELEFYKAIIAALLVREDGDVTVPREAMHIMGDLKISASSDGIRLTLRECDATEAHEEAPPS